MRRTFLRPFNSPPSRLIAVAAALLGAVPIVLYLWWAAHRIGYPYELDWLEGGAVELVGRVLHGHGLYSPPSLSYVGFTYTPLYWLLSAGVAEVTGLGFLPLRIVSTGASLLAMTVLGLYVRDATRDAGAAILSAGIFAACYQLSGDFYDLGRLDSLFLALTLLALWLGRRARSVRTGAVAGGVAFLAFFTKQVALVAVAPALVMMLAWRPRPAATALVCLGASAGIATLVLDVATHGWFLYYVVQELAGQPTVRSEYLGFWRTSLIGDLPALSLLVTLGLIVTFLRARLRRPAWATLATPAYDLAAAAGLLVCAWISVLHSGGYLNVLMPAYAAAAGIGGVAFASLRRRGWLGAFVALGLVIWQFSTLLVNIRRPLPTREDRVAGAQLLTRLDRLPGPVLVLRHPWYGTEAGKGSFAQSDGISEVLRSEGPRGAPTLSRALAGSLNRLHIQAVLLDTPPPDWMAPQLRADFRRVPGYFIPGILVPPSDINTTPRILYLRDHAALQRLTPVAGH